MPKQKDQGKHVFVLAGDPTAVHVQSAEGEALSVIDMPEALDAISTQCNRKGHRERALQAALKEVHTQLKGPFQADLPRAVASKPEAEAATDAVNEADKRTIQVCYSATICISSEVSTINLLGTIQPKQEAVPGLDAVTQSCQD